MLTGIKLEVLVVDERLVADFPPVAIGVNLPLSNSEQPTISST